MNKTAKEVAILLVLTTIIGAASGVLLQEAFGRDIVRGSTNTDNDNIDIHGSVTVTNEQNTGDSNLHNDRYWVSGHNTVVSDDFLASIIAQTTDSRDFNAAPSQSGFNYDSGDYIHLVNADKIYIGDGGGTLQVYGKATSQLVQVFYKGVPIDVIDVGVEPEDGSFISFFEYVDVPLHLIQNDPILIAETQYEKNGYIYQMQAWETPVGPAQ